MGRRTQTAVGLTLLASLAGWGANEKWGSDADRRPNQMGYR